VNEQGVGEEKTERTESLTGGQSNMIMSVIVAMVALVAVSHGTPIERLAKKGVYDLLVIFFIYLLWLRQPFTSDFVFFTPETENAPVEEKCELLEDVW
jgi:hypothetical protein